MRDVFAGSKIERLRIGDVKVNRIGLGTNRITDTQPAQELLKFAVACGINFVDTAHVYSGGESEIAIGKALAPLPENLVVATKGGMHQGDQKHNSEQFLRANLETSLSRLKTAKIKLYQLHRIDPSADFTQTIKTLKKFQTEGKIDHIGLSEVTLPLLKAARKVTDITSVQNQYSLTNRNYQDVLDYCTRHDIIFIPWFPLRDVNGDPVLQNELRPLADKYNASPQQIVLAWLLKKSPMMLPIPGSLSKEHVKSNIGAVHIELDDNDYKWLDRLA